VERSMLQGKAKSFSAKSSNSMTEAALEMHLFRYY
jgi:hypothetical protein